MTTLGNVARAQLCVMVQCENQVKRTSVAMGQAHPVWKEEVTFKSVQITSDLQVSFCSLTAHSTVLYNQSMLWSKYIFSWFGVAVCAAGLHPKLMEFMITLNYD